MDVLEKRKTIFYSTFALKRSLEQHKTLTGFLFKKANVESPTALIKYMLSMISGREEKYHLRNCEFTYKKYI